MMSRDSILSPEAVDGMIANGDTIVIFEDYVLRLNGWLGKHPGGRLAILHMVGRDATDEITAYHSEATLRTMKAYRIGRKPMGPWTNRTPPIRGGNFQAKLQTPDTPEISEHPAVAITKISGNVHDISSPSNPVDTIDVDDRIGHQPQPQPQTQSYGLDAIQGPPTPVSVDSEHDREGWTTAISLKLNQALPRGSRRDSVTPPPEQSLSSNDQGQVGAALTPAPSQEQLPLDPEKWADWAMRQGEEQDIRDYPSLDADVQEDIAAKYKVLRKQIKDQGLYNCPYIEYGKEMARYLTLFGLFLTAVSYGWYITSAVFLGLFWHQIMFTAHDAGHQAITQIFVVDTLIALFVADFCCGLSMGWWKSSHNVHHLITNQPEHDPDIQNVPLFATCPSFLKSLHSTYYDFKFAWDKVADVMVPYQKYTYYPVMGIARFNLYLLSWLHVLSAKSSSLGNTRAWWIRPTEIAFMACYWFLFGYLLLWRTLPDWTTRVVFVLVSHIITMPLHVQITLSHWGMSTSTLSENESFPQRQLRTTMDVDCPAWLDFIHGGLQFQAVHHLFPRVPRHNLRKVQVMVREFCAETGIPYSILGFVDGNKKVLSRLNDIGEQVKIMVNCQKFMAVTGESGLH